MKLPFDPELKSAQVRNRLRSEVAALRAAAAARQPRSSLAAATEK